jgi:CRP-like cAMP-binding protein
MTSDNIRRYAAHSIVFRENEIGDCAYLVRSGAFEIFQGSGDLKRTIAIVRPGVLFGELAIIDHGRRMATARCLEPGELILINKQKLESKLLELTRNQKIAYQKLIEFVRTETPCTISADKTPKGELNQKSLYIEALIKKIESDQQYKTGDTFLDGLTRTLTLYAKRRLPIRKQIHARELNES